MCEGMYYPEELVNLEIEVLRALSWRLNGPTPQDFIQQFVQLMPPSADKNVVKKLVEQANRNVELAMNDYDLAIESYSTIALASIAAAIRTVGSEMGPGDVNDWMDSITFVMSGASVPDIE